MKVYVSVDIEGVAGATHWDETDKTKPDYNEFRDQMTAEAAAACRSALAAGASEIRVKDAHGSGRNLIASKLPVETKLIRGWSGHPFSMMQEIDDSFDAALMVGYHSSAATDTNPLAHTITGGLAYIKINGQYASEFHLNAQTAAYYNVPVVFISGDRGICDAATEAIPSITSVAVKEGKGDMTMSMHPALAVERIEKGVGTALKGGLKDCCIRLPELFSVDVRYHLHARALRASFFPGMQLKDPYTVSFETDDHFEVMRALSFILKV